MKSNPYMIDQYQFWKDIGNMQAAMDLMEQAADALSEAHSCFAHGEKNAGICETQEAAKRAREALDIIYTSIL
jgi:hypothetical protein